MLWYRQSPAACLRFALPGQLARLGQAYYRPYHQPYLGFRPEIHRPLGLVLHPQISLLAAQLSRFWWARISSPAGAAKPVKPHHFLPHWREAFQFLLRGLHLPLANWPLAHQ